MTTAILFEQNQFINMEHAAIEHAAVQREATQRYDIDIDKDTKAKFELCLKLGNSLMLFSLIAFVMAVLIGYQFQNLVSMPVEIAAHIFSMILPGFFKIGYVLRCIGRKHLGKQV